jgi:hypothetical protein
MDEELMILEEAPLMLAAGNRMSENRMVVAEPLKVVKEEQEPPLAIEPPMDRE